MIFFKSATIFFCVLFSLAFTNFTFAQDASVQKLMEVEEQLRDEQKKNEQTKENIAQLEKKVQCTYNLVKGYENCDASFTEKSEDYLACVQQARQEKETCMLELAVETP